MAITLVQSVRASGNSGTTASATLASTTAGNLLVALVDCEQNPGNPTITAPASWTQANTTVTQNIFISLNGAHFYYANNPGALTTVSFTFSVAVSAWHIELLEFSGVATATPLDVSALRSQGGTLSPSSGSVTTTAAGDLVIGWMIEDDVNGAYTFTSPTGWTALPRNQDAGVWASQYSAYQVQAAAGAIQYNPTLSSTQTDSIVGILAFKAAGGGGSTPLTASPVLAKAVTTTATLSTSVPLTSSPTLSVAVTPANALLSTSVPLSSSSTVALATTAPNATLSTSVPLTASPALAIAATPATPATLSTSVPLTSAPVLAKATTAAASLAVAVPLTSSPVLAVAIAPNTTLNPGGGALTASPVLARAITTTATLSTSVPLGSSPTLATAVTQPVSLLLAVQLATAAALAHAVTLNAVLFDASSSNARPTAHSIALVTANVVIARSIVPVTAGIVTGKSVILTTANIVTTRSVVLATAGIVTAKSANIVTSGIPTARSIVT